jgi:hypothetical protein
MGLRVQCRATREGNTLADDVGYGGVADDGWYYYAHLDTVSSALAINQWVPAGTYLGTLGQTGNASGTAPHLHFSISPDGNYNAGIDPYSLLKAAEGTACSTSRVGRDAAGTFFGAISTCHSRNGGSSAAGTPFDNGGSPHVHRWGAGVVQDNNGGTLGPNTCMQRDGSGTAWMVRGGIWTASVHQLGGAGSFLGYSVGEEFAGPTGPRQNFEGGYIAWNGSGFSALRY